MTTECILVGILWVFDGSVFRALGLDTMNDLSVRHRCIIGTVQVVMSHRAKTTVSIRVFVLLAYFPSSSSCMLDPACLHYWWCTWQTCSDLMSYCVNTHFCSQWHFTSSFKICSSSYFYASANVVTGGIVSWLFMSLSVCLSVHPEMLTQSLDKYWIYFTKLSALVHLG